MKYIYSLLKSLKSLFPYMIFLGFGILCWRWFAFSSKGEADLAEPIVNGVIGGVVTSFLLIIVSIVWRSNITPWIENLLYKDTKIEGVWNGVLVPFIGIEEIDKRRIKIAFGIVERRRKQKKNKAQAMPQGNNTTRAVSVAASTSDIEGDRDIEAELIIKDAPQDIQDGEGELIDRKFFIQIGSGTTPIEVRVEIKRVGHSVMGQIVEIGGASDIHTYGFKGSFKNLILTGEYENQDSAHIDRGSLSLMLRENGRSLEGFFSSYADGDHAMAPFKCVLKRQDRNSNGS